MSKNPVSLARNYLFSSLADRLPITFLDGRLFRLTPSSIGHIFLRLSSFKNPVFLPIVSSYP